MSEHLTEQDIDEVHGALEGGFPSVPMAVKGAEVIGQLQRTGIRLHVERDVARQALLDVAGVLGTRLDRTEELDQWSRLGRRTLAAAKNLADRWCSICNQLLATGITHTNPREQGQPCGVLTAISIALNLPDVRSGSKWIRALPHGRSQVRVCNDIAEARVWPPRNKEWGRWGEHEFGLRDLDCLCELIPPGTDDIIAAVLPPSDLPSDWWTYHAKGCGTESRGCVPGCPKDTYEKTGVWPK